MGKEREPGMSIATRDCRKELRDAFIEAHGYWNQAWESLLELDPDFFEAYVQMSSVPARTGHLAPKIREFVYIAVDAAATHLYVFGLRQHIRNALAYGATKEEVLEVIELASLLGLHACTVGVPILVEEAAALQTGAGATTTVAR